MRLIDVDALPNGRVEWEDIENAPTVEPPKELVYSVTVTMDTDEVIGRLMESGWGPVKHGRWIIDTKFGADVMSGEQMVICSECGRGIFWGKQNYCPNCGAKMDEV